MIAIQWYRPWQDDCRPICRCSRCDQRIVNEDKSHLRPLQLELYGELRRRSPLRWSDRSVAELLNIRPATLRAWIDASPQYSQRRTVL